MQLLFKRLTAMKRRELTEIERQKLNEVRATSDCIDPTSFERAHWIMQTFGYFDDDNNGRFTVYYSPSSTEVNYIDRICLRIGFNRKGN